MSSLLRTAIATIAINSLIWQPFVLSAQEIQAMGGTNVGQTSYGVPLININAPSASGVSQNQYQNFNVNSYGAVFNNATQDTTTVIGGDIRANKNFNGSSAKIILNEVKGTSASNLNGYMEVGGDKAGVVIANPNGITCNGCGYVNTANATLTTGSAQMDNGAITGYNVQGGTITINGDGLDASRTDKADLISRAVKLNASIYANKLNVKTGANNPSTPAPNVSIDSAALGGMYANSINIQGTENGVGINLPEAVVSGSGGVTINANGKITVANVSSAGDVTIHAKAADVQVKADKQVRSMQNATVNGANVKFDAGSSVVTGEKMSVQADNFTNQGNVIAGVNSEGLFQAGGDISFNANNTVHNQGEVLATGSLAVNGRQIDNEGQLLSLAAQAILATDGVNNSGSLNAITQLSVSAKNINNEGLMASETEAQVTATNTVNNTGAIQAAETAVVATSIENAGQIRADNSLTLEAAGLINKSDEADRNALILSGGIIDVTSEQFTNSGDNAVMVAANGIGFNAEAELHNSGSVLSDVLVTGSAKDYLADTADGLGLVSKLLANLSNSEDTGTFSAKTIALNNNILSDNDASLAFVAEGNVRLTGTLSAEQIEVVSDGDAAINGKINASKAFSLIATGDTSLAQNLTSNVITVTGKNIDLADVSSTASSAEASGNKVIVIGAGHVSLNQLDAIDSVIIANNNLTVDAIKTTGSAQLRSSLGDVTITQSHDNIQGDFVVIAGQNINAKALSADGTIVLNAQADLSTQSLASTTADILVSANNVNIDGTVVAEDDVHMKLSADLRASDIQAVNGAIALQAGGNTYLDSLTAAENIDVVSGAKVHIATNINTAKDLYISSAGNTHLNGDVSVGGGVNIDAADQTYVYGDVDAGGNILLSGDQYLRLEGGLLSGQSIVLQSKDKHITANAGAIDGRDIQAGNSVFINAGGNAFLGGKVDANDGQIAITAGNNVYAKSSLTAGKQTNNIDAGTIYTTSAGITYIYDDVTAAGSFYASTGLTPDSGQVSGGRFWVNGGDINVSDNMVINAKDWITLYNDVNVGGTLSATSGYNLDGSASDGSNFHAIGKLTTGNLVVDTTGRIYLKQHVQAKRTGNDERTGNISLNSAANTYIYDGLDADGWFSSVAGKTTDDGTAAGKQIISAAYRNDIGNIWSNVGDINVADNMILDARSWLTLHSDVDVGGTLSATSGYNLDGSASDKTNFHAIGKLTTGNLVVDTTGRIYLKQHVQAKRTGNDERTGNISLNSAANTYIYDGLDADGWFSSVAGKTTDDGTAAGKQIISAAYKNDIGNIWSNVGDINVADNMILDARSWLTLHSDVDVGGTLSATSGYNLDGSASDGSNFHAIGKLTTGNLVVDTTGRIYLKQHVQAKRTGNDERTGNISLNSAANTYIYDGLDADGWFSSVAGKTTDDGTAAGKQIISAAYRNDIGNIWSNVGDINVADNMILDARSWLTLHSDVDVGGTLSATSGYNLDGSASDKTNFHAIGTIDASNLSVNTTGRIYLKNQVDIHRKGYDLDTGNVSLMSGGNTYIYEGINADGWISATAGKVTDDGTEAGKQIVSDVYKNDTGLFWAAGRLTGLDVVAISDDNIILREDATVQAQRNVIFNAENYVSVVLNDAPVTAAPQYGANDHQIKAVGGSVSIRSNDGSVYMRAVDIGAKNTISISAHNNVYLDSEYEDKTHKSRLVSNRYDDLFDSRSTTYQASLVKKSWWRHDTNVVQSTELKESISKNFSLTFVEGNRLSAQQVFIGAGVDNENIVWESNNKAENTGLATIRNTQFNILPNINGENGMGGLTVLSANDINIADRKVKYSLTEKVLTTTKKKLASFMGLSYQGSEATHTEETFKNKAYTSTTTSGTTTQSSSGYLNDIIGSLETQIKSDGTAKTTPSYAVYMMSRGRNLNETDMVGAHNLTLFAGGNLIGVPESITGIGDLRIHSANSQSYDSINANNIHLSSEGSIKLSSCTSFLCDNFVAKNNMTLSGKQGLELLGTDLIAGGNVWLHSSEGDINLENGGRVYAGYEVRDYSGIRSWFSYRIFPKRVSVRADSQANLHLLAGGSVKVAAYVEESPAISKYKDNDNYNVIAESGAASTGAIMATGDLFIQGGSLVRLTGTRIRSGGATNIVGGQVVIDAAQKIDKTSATRFYNSSDRWKSAITISEVASSIHSGADLNIAAGVIYMHGGTLRAAGDINLVANAEVPVEAEDTDEKITLGSIVVEASQTGHESFYRKQWDTNNGKDHEVNTSRKTITNHKAKIQAGGNISFTASKNVLAHASDITANGGQINVKADHDITLGVMYDAVNNTYNKTSKFNLGPFGNLFGLLDSEETRTSFKTDPTGVDLAADALDARAYDTFTAENTHMNVDSVFIKAKNVVIKNAYSSVQETVEKSKGNKDTFFEVEVSQHHIETPESRDWDVEKLVIETEDLSVEGTKINADTVAITADIISLISAKNSESYSKFKDESGVVLRTIESSGYIKETAAEASINSANIQINGEQLVENTLSSEALVENIGEDNFGLSNVQIDLVQAELENKEWSEKTTTLSATGQLIVQALTTYFAPGLGDMVVGSASGVVNSAIKAALNNLARQATQQVITAAITGEDLKLDLDEMVKGAVKAGISAGLTQQLNATVLKHVDTKIGQSIANNMGTAAITTAINGGKFEDNLKSIVLDDVNKRVAKYIGDKTAASSLKNVISHAALGCVAGEIKGDDCGSGATGGALSAIIAPQLDKLINVEGGGSKAEIDERKQNLALLTEVSAGILATAGGKDTVIAAWSAKNEVNNNYLNHTQVDDMKDKLSACSNDANPSQCRANVRKSYAELSEKQDAELKALCANGVSDACRTGLNEAAWYVNEGSKENYGIINDLWDDETEKTERSRGAAAVADTIFSEGFDKEDLVAAYLGDYKAVDGTDTTGLQQRHHLFGTLDQYYQDQGHETAWTALAWGVTGGNLIFDLQPMDGKGGLINIFYPKNKAYLNEAGEQILLNGYKSLSDLHNADAPVTGDAAKQWDSDTLRIEQQGLQDVTDKYNTTDENGDSNRLKALNDSLVPDGNPLNGHGNFNDVEQRIEYGEREMQQIRTNKNSLSDDGYISP